MNGLVYFALGMLTVCAACAVALAITYWVDQKKYGGGR